LQASFTNNNISTAGCVLSYSVAKEHKATDNSGSHYLTTYVVDFRNAVLIQQPPDPGLYRKDADLDLAQSRPFYGVIVRFTTPQPRQFESTGFDSKGATPAQHDSAPKLSAGLYSDSLEDSVHLKDAINQAIQACGGAANVAASVPIAPAAAQASVPSGPSAKETSDFIISKINDSVIYSQGLATFPDGSSAPMRQWLTQTIRFLGSGDCGVRWNIHIKRQQQDRRTGEWDDGQDDDYASGTALVQDFHVTSSRISEWSPQQQWDPPIYQISMPYGRNGSLTLVTGDQEMANRVQHALVGMGKICGAKDEPY